MSSLMTTMTLVLTGSAATPLGGAIAATVGGAVSGPAPV